MSGFRRSHFLIRNKTTQTLYEVMTDAALAVATNSTSSTGS
jgi:hypothetical protein